MQFSILLFTPFLSKIILQIQLQPQEFVTGMCVVFFSLWIFNVWIFIFFFAIFRLVIDCWILIIVSYRFGYILLYANYIIKWGGSNPGTLIAFFFLHNLLLINGVFMMYSSLWYAACWGEFCTCSCDDSGVESARNFDCKFPRRRSTLVGILMRI
jgi:hypothetical protein